MPLSHFVPAYPSPSPCPQVHSLRLLYVYVFIPVLPAVITEQRVKQYLVTSSREPSLTASSTAQTGLSSPLCSPNSSGMPHCDIVSGGSEG